MKKIIILTTIFIFFGGCTLTPLVARGTVNNKITILEQKNLYFSDRGDIPFEGLSDLTYDKKNHKLYMIADRGYLYEFSAIFDKKIEKLKYLKAFHLKAPNGKIIHPDIEGLTHNPQGELIASFERNPRVKRITKQGKLKYNYKIPNKLQKKSIYKTPNSIFESITYHPKYGILVVAEYPIKRKKNSKQSIYSLNGKEWNFKAQSYPNSAVTAIEVMDDNNILVLERAYNGLSNPFYITLKKVYIDKCDENRECKSEVLATFSSSDGWGYNNFEGLAKVGKNRFVMVSDNNGHTLLPTTLTYFEVNR